MLRGYPPPRGTGPAALNHGFHVALYVLAGLSLVGAAFAAAVGRPSRAPEERVIDDTYVLREAA